MKEKASGKPSARSTAGSVVPVGSVAAQIIRFGEDACKHAGQLVTGGVAAKVLLSAIDQLVDMMAQFCAKLKQPFEATAKGMSRDGLLYCFRKYYRRTLNPGAEPDAPPPPAA